MGWGCDRPSMKVRIPKAWVILDPLRLVAAAFSQTGGGADRAARTSALPLAAGSTNRIALSQLADNPPGSSDVQPELRMKTSPDPLERDELEFHANGGSHPSPAMIQDRGGLNAQRAAFGRQEGIDISDAARKGREKGGAGRRRPENIPYGFWRRARWIFMSTTASIPALP